MTTSSYLTAIRDLTKDYIDSTEATYEEKIDGLNGALSDIEDMKNVYGIKYDKGDGE